MPTWINANGGNWSTGANWDTGSAPTSGTDCIIDAASFAADGKVITIDAAASCLNLDCSLADQIFTFTSSVYTLSVYGNVTLHATKSKFAFTNTAYMYQRGTGTITTNGNLFLAWNRFYIDGVGITVTLGDAMYLVATIHFLNGIWTTNNKNLTVTGEIHGVATSARTLNLGSSVIYCSAWLTTNYPTGLTFNCGTSAIHITSGDLYTKGQTFYDVYIDNTCLTGDIFGTTVATFNKLTKLGRANITSRMGLECNINISNLLTITGANATTQRVLTQSNTIGTPRTITIATGAPTPVLTNCDFQDIHLHNTDADPLDLSARTDIGDCGGNSGITFPPALNLYIVHTSGAMSVSNVAKWKLADLTSAGRVPLPQDSAFGVAGSFTGTSTVTMDCPRIGSLDLSGVNQAVTWTLGNAISCYGNYVLGTNITPSGNFAVTEMTRTSANINLYGKTIYDLIINAYGGTVTFLSNFVFRLFTQTTGTIVMGSYTFESNLITALTAWTYTAGTVTPGTSTIKLNPASGSVNITFAGGGKTYNIVQFSGLHTGNFDITGNNTFAQLIIDPGRKVRLTGSSIQTITPTGLFTAVGNSSNRITLTTVSGTASIVYLGTGYHQLDYCDISNLTVSATSKFYAGRNSTNGGGNTNWIWGNCLTLSANLVVNLTLTNQLTTIKYLTALLVINPTVTDQLTALRALSASLSGVTALSATLTAIQSLRADLVAGISLQAQLTKIMSLSADMDCETSVTVNLTALLALSAILDCETQLTADMTIKLTEIPYLTDPLGIDKLIQETRLRLLNKLFNGKDYLSAGQAYLNVRNGDTIPECYLGNNEYLEMLLDDKKDVISFFTVDPDMEVKMSEVRVKVNIYFIVNLKTLYSLPHRAVEEVQIMTLKELNYSPFQVNKLITGLESLSNFDVRRPELMNMEPYYCFRYETTITYKC